MVKTLALFAVGAAAADFDAYLNKFGKAYNGEDEYATRKAIYEENMKWIEAENAKGNSWTVGETRFTDLTNEEFKTQFVSGYKAPSAVLGNLPYLGEHETVESTGSVDWTTKGAVTPVKDQGQCGSCWSFSTTGSIEGAWEISSGNLKSLSEQQFVDCDKSSMGCNGGNMNTAIAWAEKQNIATESSYPYTARDGTCKSSFTTAIPKGGVTGYKSVGSLFSKATVASLESAIDTTPVSIAIEADQSSFQHYTGGILSSGCGTNLDHGVLAVGYNTAQGYWLVKNSWGKSWGDNGYIKLSQTGNVCGILNQPVYPTVSSSVSATGACSADDQAAISDPDTIGKKAADCGKSAYNIATGNFNHDKFNSCLTSSAGISAGCSECYAVSGEFGAKNCKAACLLGWCKSGCLDCVKPAQADLDTCTGFTSGSATPCLSATGACSADDQANLADAKTVGDKQDKCGKDALGLSGIDHDKFTSCAQSELSISSGCAECYYAVADYGFKNCKAACLLGWCKEGCLSCTQPAQDTLAGCAGFTPSKAEPCLESKAGACSDDEKAAIQGLSAKDFGDKSNKCGTQALGLTGINHDKFNSCMKTEVGIDTACAECYAVTADYGFKNCKAACLLGWCKSGCLSCTQPAQDDLPACTGFAAGSADPCLDDVVV